MRTSSIIRLSAALFLSIGSAVWFAGGAPAQTSDKGLEFLSHASSAFDSGDYGEAATYIEEAMKTGLPKDLAARATLMRGQINERNGLLARALQDYSSALWMDTLSSSDKQKAADGKERVIAAMGLNTSQPGIARQVTSSGSGSTVPQAAPASSSGGVFGMFGGLFGSSTPPQPTAPPAEPPAASGGMFSGLFGSSAPSQPPPPPASPPKPAWQTATAEAAAVIPKVDATEPVRAPRKTVKPAPAQASKIQTASLQPVSISNAGSGFLIVFGSAPSEAAGHSRARQIKAQLADILVSRELNVESAGGSYTITAGPYKAKSAALALCSAMKQRGVSCQVTP